MLAALSSLSRASRQEEEGLGAVVPIGPGGAELIGSSIHVFGLRNHYLRADAVPPTPKKRGRRRLTALEVLQARSAFCRSQRIFLRLACFWERFEGSAEAATKGAPVPPIGGLTVLRIPSKKGKAGMLLDLGTRVGWRASRGA